MRTPMTYIDRARVGAGRLGISVGEYLSHKEQGEIWCSLGKHWAASTAVSPGAKNYCKAHNAQRVRERYAKSSTLTPLTDAQHAGRQRIGLRRSAHAGGVSVEVYLQHRDAGERWCSRCRQFLTAEHFFRVRTSRCRTCEREYRRQRSAAT